MILNINFEYSSGNYYLCYMDENNLLNIIEDAHLKITSFESNIRRFYLVGDFANKIIHSEVSLKGSNKYGYEAKLCINKENPNYSDFIYSSSSVAIINDINTIYENAIPIDILITSSNSDESTVNLNINIEIKDTSIVAMQLTDTVVIGDISSDSYYNVTINGQLYSGIIGFRDNANDLISLFATYNIEVKPLDSNFQEVFSVDSFYNNTAYASFHNISGNKVDIEILVVDGNPLVSYYPMDNGINNSVVFSEIDYNYYVNFSLSSLIYNYSWELKTVEVVGNTSNYIFSKGLIETEVNVDLTTAITTSLSDTDMQQWQAVKDAANELTGVTNWSFDVPGSRIVYKQPTDPYVSSEYSYRCLVGSSTFLADSLITCAQSYAEYNNLTFVNCPPFTPTSSYQYPSCSFQYPNGNSTGFVVADTYWNPREIPEAPDEYISFDTLAQKIISNASASNENVSLLAQAYLENIANSVSNSDESKQFITLDYLKSLLPN